MTSSTAAKIVHQETIRLRVTPQQIKRFILTPERILDYYPGGIDDGILEPGQSIYCRAKSGISILELVPQECQESKVVVKVTTATKIEPPYTVERIKASVFFTMIEDWEMETDQQGTLLTKTWRNIEKHKMKFMPMSFMVKRGAKKESAHLAKPWEEAAGSSDVCS